MMGNRRLAEFEVFNNFQNTQSRVFLQQRNNLYSGRGSKGGKAPVASCLKFHSIDDNLYVPDCQLRLKIVDINPTAVCLMSTK